MFAADDEGRALVDSGGLMSRMRSRAVGGEAAGLLRDEGEGVGFVEEAELAAGLLFGGRVEEDAAFEQRAVEVGDEGADVARAVLAAQRAGAKLADVVAIARRARWRRWLR